MANALKWVPNWEWTDIEIVLENCNFFWRRSHLRELREMWDKNYSIQYMANYFDRDPDEILLALLHLSKENRVSKRKFGLFGGIG